MVETTSDDGIGADESATVRLPHGLEIKDVEQIQQQLSAALDGAASVTVDISHVAAVDTAGVQLLLALKTEAENRGIPLTFAGQSAPFSQALTVLGLLDTFAAANSRASAV
jgi:anti-anti-sigma regulatory factor